MGKANGGNTYKRLAVNLPEELDRSLLNLRKKDEYIRCSYGDLIRILIREGAKALGVYPRNTDT